MLFTPAEVLRESFEVYGKFYKYHIDGRSLKMRGQAKIVRKDADTEQADCIVIMINPGSRTPSETYVYPSHHGKSEFVKVKDDQTQHQMMRLMERVGYNRLDIINLSDICESNLTNFFRLMKDFQSQGSNAHSIFSKQRADEVKEIIGHDTPIILGWGTGVVIKGLAEKALTSLGDRGNIYGVKHAKHPFYYHPKPPVIKNRIQWLERMEAQLKGEPCFG
ncbi:DUF1643 domain-containing protein [Siminovitchia acidinfaciens]|nr:DUF1643 domain-containing protein [Siminovitchia acidinfaciens]